jgi:hypothetical protein
MNKTIGDLSLATLTNRSLNFCVRYFTFAGHIDIVRIADAVVNDLSIVTHRCAHWSSFSSHCPLRILYHLIWLAFVDSRA